MNLMRKKTAVLYHYPCPDGAFAALAAHLFFSSASLPALFFPNTVYNPFTTQQLPLAEISDVYLLDFVGPCGFVQEISSKVSRVVVLDHHKTAVERLCGENCSVGENVMRVIDVTRSGATIAFDYFKERVGCEVALGQFDRVRRLFEYIEDGDLWRWSLPNSKAFNSGLKDLNIEFDVGLNPNLFEQSRHDELIQKQKLIDDVLSQSYEIALGGGAFGHCLAVNADSISELRSELGQQLATKSRNLKLRAIGAVVYRVPELENDQLLKISLRSVDSEDTTPVSEEFGGGGHRNASSFMLSSVEFKQWKVCKNA
ncbi:hypothetical protein FNV43_RR20926 [Rhamnella rubrinervis]|uniref:DHHA1 domain-containing protein n=1 Tax=Rhamnella rubrinervis TaxID=2594499 RepID=A0A8K0DVQ6_9ROSA|nr:hypothetical protein FNV43_RR20926 [Rhamnella rubrinervis]